MEKHKFCLKGSQKIHEFLEKCAKNTIFVKRSSAENTISVKGSWEKWIYHQRITGKKVQILIRDYWGGGKWFFLLINCIKPHKFRQRITGKTLYLN